MKDFALETPERVLNNILGDLRQQHKMLAEEYLRHKGIVNLLGDDMDKLDARIRAYEDAILGVQGME